jgi:hypothetical protein
MMKFTGKAPGLKGVLIAFFARIGRGGAALRGVSGGGRHAQKRQQPVQRVHLYRAWSTTKIPMLAFEGASMG